MPLSGQCREPPDTAVRFSHDKADFMIKFSMQIGAGLLATVTTAAVAQDADIGPPVGVNTGEDAAAAGGMPSGAAGGRPETVFDGDWLSVGLGAGYGPSYSGSDDYVIFPLPVLQGSLGGIGIQPRPAGIALDFIPDADTGVTFGFGPTVRLRNDRADQIKDPVVELAGELDRAVEVGAAGAISLPGVLNPFDSLTFSSDIRWDVAGAHGGMTIEPGLTYFTPLNRGTIASLSVGASYASDDFSDYYFSVNPAQAAASGLPQFAADGGFTSFSANVLMGFDLSGDATDGGWGIVGLAGYSRMVGDAKNTPYTSIRGDADQWRIGMGLGYTF